MKLGKLEKIVAKYMRLNVTDWKVAGGDGFNMFIAAANNARQFAEQSHNFTFALVEGTLSLDLQDGASLTGMVDSNDDAISVNQISKAYINGQYGMLPLDVIDKRQMASRVQEQLRLGTFGGRGDNDVYPNVNWWTNYSGFEASSYLLRVGNIIKPYPGGVAGTTKDFSFDVYKWLDNYPDEDYEEIEDEFLLYGQKYMLYACICEMNFLAKEFVSRQEGNISSPTGERDTALQQMIVNDAYSSVDASEHIN